MQARVLFCVDLQEIRNCGFLQSTRNQSCQNSNEDRTGKRLLEYNNCDYKQETGGTIGRTTFQKVHPKTTVCVDQAKRTSRLCEYCTNVALKLSVFKANNIDMGDAYMM